ncbi:MAG: transcription-repair coupling factor, partial [Desulfobacterales bacterium]
PQAQTEILARVRTQAAALELPLTRTRGIVEQIKTDGYYGGLESLISLVYPRLDTFFDYLSPMTPLITLDPDDTARAAEKVALRMAQNYAGAREEQRLCVAPEALILNEDLLADEFHRRPGAEFRMFSLGAPAADEVPEQTSIDFEIKEHQVLMGELAASRGREASLAPLARWLSEKRLAGYRTLMTCGNRSQGQRLQELLQPYGVEVRPLAEFNAQSPAPGEIGICVGQLSTGLDWAGANLALLTEDEIFGKKSVRRKPSPPKVASELLSFDELKIGDLVVHREHGIGQYQGLSKLKLDGATDDYLLITYKGGDKLYLPVVRMGMIQKYMGVDGIVPVLDKMGGTSWAKVKSRIKRSVEQIAGRLLKIYAARKVKEGLAFEVPEGYFRDFEAGFEHEETADQIKAIREVISDMERPTPMDRLVCGDVGYGKTEVALRAAFIAVHSGRQVAVLVPTTVLAEQHYSTFAQRFAPYGVKVACLSRFRSAQEQRRIIKKLNAGSLDIVIGTHRMLSKDVRFHDLGLMILDEEQRFGVRQKEKLKGLRETVDVLALTATPIPRTLHMSMMGVRDISVISTPPEARRPIMTYVSEFDDAVVADAVRSELSRGGQVFFVHNTIHTIHIMARRLQELVPEVRLAVAHGQLNEGELEEVMYGFLKGELDMLVCTTIIESGLDIPAANTILVNRADRFGLAQMYQLRGRVGRAGEQAYAYLFIPKETTLTKDAQKRLKVLMEHSDLGSGFQIAMSDLQIRGGGTILGASQSGHIAAVGYDMFLELMEHAMGELKGEPVLEPLEPEINVSLSAYIPEDYVPDIDQRLTFYRRLARLADLSAVAAMKAEMEDRFGALPKPASNLLLKIMLKALARQAGVQRLDLVNGELHLSFSEAHMAHPEALSTWVTRAGRAVRTTPGNGIQIELNPGVSGGQLGQAKNILKEISERVNAL